jgi:tRNA A-37 threonylcarbamoyl transferase component Bud32
MCKLIFYFLNFYSKTIMSRSVFYALYNQHLNSKMTNAYGNIYTACNVKKCNYILKVMYLKKDKKSKKQNIDLDSFYNGIKNQQIASKYGIASPIYDYYVQKESCGIVMEKYCDTLLDRLNSFVSIKQKKKYLDTAFLLLEKLHRETGISHNDAHLTNFMFDIENTLKLIDFGTSKISSESEQQYSDFRVFLVNAKQKYKGIDKEELLEYWSLRMTQSDAYKKYMFMM